MTASQAAEPMRHGDSCRARGHASPECLPFSAVRPSLWPKLLYMFNSVDVNTMFTKRRQTFFNGFEQLNNLVCKITMSCNCN